MASSNTVCEFASDPSRVSTFEGPEIISEHIGLAYTIRILDFASFGLV